MRPQGLSRRAFLAGAIPPRQNVLFITIDDLRPQLGCYGDVQAKTPHIDALAKRGTVFERAYCQQALCGPSRTSFLTGLRPDTTKVHDIETHFRKTVPNAVTLPQLFKQNGYYTRGFYKVFHLAGFDPGIGNLNDPPSWSAPHVLPKKSVYGPDGAKLLADAYARLAASGKKASYTDIPRSVALEAPDVADSDLSDGEMADAVIAELEAKRNEPFFLAAGFYKPHLPHVAPKRYWDLYDPAKLKLPANQYAPEDSPAWAVNGNAELRSYTDIPDEGPIDEVLGRRILHGYLASVSYVDAQVGRLLQALDRLRLRGNTTVVLLGDHGYQIGEHGMWSSKHTNFETSCRVPLIVSAPGYRPGRSRSLAELVDVYPTLAEIAKLTPPKELEGKSFVPVLRDPRRQHKPAAYSQYPRGGRMGRSVRTARYRYTEWTKPSATAPDAIELYDHFTDPEENRNVARRYPDACRRHAALLERA